MKEIFKKAKEIKLAKEEKDFLRNILLSHIEKNPVRNNRFFRLRLLENKIAEIFSTLKIFKTAPALSLSLSALILIIATGSATAFAAINSLPDEFFYPVKINVIEKIKSLSALSPEKKAELEIKIAGERLKEIEILAHKKRLNPNIVEKTEMVFEKHINNISEISLNLKKENKNEEAAKLDLSLETTLLAHKEIANAMRGEFLRDKETELSVKKLQRSIENKTENAGGRRRDFEEKLKSSGDDFKIKTAEKRKEDAEKTVREVKNFSGKNKKNIGDEIIKETERIVKEAERDIKEGKKKVSEGKTDEASILFQKAEISAKTINEITNVAASIPELEIKTPFQFKFKENEKDKVEIKIDDEKNEKIGENENNKDKNNKSKNREKGAENKDEQSKSGKSGGEN